MRVHYLLFIIKGASVIGQILFEGFKNLFRVAHQNIISKIY